MTETEIAYAEAQASGKRFIDQVRNDPPADTSFISRKYLDIPYAEGSERRKLDIYLPDQEAEKYPVLIDIYGGGWYFGNRSSYKADMALTFVKKGYAVVSIDYTLSKDAKYPTQIYEIKAAIRYLKNHAREYHLDPERFALMGESAGSHLGSIAATSVGAGVYEDIPFGEAGDASVNCMIALYCPANLAATKAQFEVLQLATWVPEGGRSDSPEGVLLGKAINEVPELVRAANPETYVTSKSPAFLFFHGDDDRVVPYIQSMNFAAKLIEAIGPEKVEHYLKHGCGHNQVHYKTEENYKLIDSFLNKHNI